MSSFRVDLTEANERNTTHDPVSTGKLPRGRRILAIIAAILASLVLVGGVGSYFYWQGMKSTPQYSLALLVDAAKRDDQKTIATIVDVDAVVDDFVPQVTAKAVELYGRGLPPKIVSQLAQLAVPIMPAVKERARAELPRIIRERVERFGDVPFAAMVLGAGKYLDITISGDTALVKSKLPEHPLEMKMRRNGERWQIVGVNDDNLASEIAKKIGQDIITIALNGGARKTADTLGVGSLTNLLRQAEELIK